MLSVPPFTILSEGPPTEVPLRNKSKPLAGNGPFQRWLLFARFITSADSDSALEGREGAEHESPSEMGRQTGTITQQSVPF